MDKLAPQKVTYPYIEKMYWMHGIRIAPLTVSVKGKEVTLPRWLSGNGDSIRLFPTKKQAEAVMKYYTELLLEKEKKVEEMQENNPITLWEPQPTSQQAE